MNFIPEFVWPGNVVIDGVTIQIRKTPYSFGTKWLLTKSNKYELAERTLINGVLKPGHIIFEMGGSIGILTAIMARLVGSEGKVISIEASANLTSFSKGWLEKKGNIHVLTGFAFPVYECNKNITIKSFDEAYGAMGGVLSFETSSNTNALVNTGEDIYDIKSVINKFNTMPDILVVDIEGSERIMLEADNKLPDTIKYILIELHPHIYGEQCKEQIILNILQQKFTLRSQVSNVYLFANAS